ncbi:hypothetical protein DUI87_21976 [Hirundo rustica rustica]|uniref:Ig-like domain-containing protein n=1 Tax=Hirundo rustica rustica TaxID=333673 RepID=A0A3M0JLF3_HIRRU|nr:hypothetical protein DUI87_21976 [Hirundo rustica rustica]
MAAGPGPWLLALALALWPAAVIGQVTLEQHPREVTVQEGNAVTFECSMRGGDMSRYYMYWYRQGPRGTLEWIYREGDKYGEGFQGHFVGRVERSRTTLQILSAKQGDAATYYCGARITLEQLCSRVNQKPTDGEDRSQHFFLAAAPRAPVRQWQSTEEAFGKDKDPFNFRSNKGQKQTSILQARTATTTHGKQHRQQLEQSQTHKEYIYFHDLADRGQSLSNSQAEAKRDRRLNWAHARGSLAYQDIPSTSDPQVIVMTSKKSGEGGSTGKAACLARNFRTKNISLEMPSEEVLYEQSTSILTSEGLYNAIKVVNVTKDTELTCTAKFDNSTITSVPATEEEAEEPVPGPSDRVCNSTDPSAQAVIGQVTLEQHPREVTVQEGDAVTFECSMRGDDMRSYLMFWYRQGPRGTLEWIYRGVMRDTQEGSKSFKFCSSCPTSSPSAVTDRGRDQEGLGLSAVPEAQAGQGWAELLCRQREGGERPDRAVLAMWSALCVAFLPIVAVTGQMTLEQHPREVTVQEGNAVTFECSMRGGDMSNYYMYWYRQGPRGTLEWIYHEDGIYGEGFQGHFVGSVESSRTTLQILSAKQGDSATYYCGARITLEQLCSRVNQKPTDGEDRSQHVFLAAAPRAPVRHWQSTEEAFGKDKDPFNFRSNKGQKQTSILQARTATTTHGKQHRQQLEQSQTHKEYIYFHDLADRGQSLSNSQAEAKRDRRLNWAHARGSLAYQDIPSTSDPQVIVMTSKKSGEGGSTGKAACLARNFRTKNISLEMPSEEVLYEQSTSILTSEGLYNAIKVVNVTKDTELTCTAKFDNSTITSVPATEEEAEEPVPGPSDRVCNSTDPSAQDLGAQRFALALHTLLWGTAAPLAQTSWRMAAQGPSPIARDSLCLSWPHLEQFQGQESGSLPMLTWQGQRDLSPYGANSSCFFRENQKSFLSDREKEGGKCGLSFPVGLDGCYQLCPSVSAGFKEDDFVLPLVQSTTSIALTFPESWSAHGLFLLSTAVSLAGAATLEQPREVTAREGNRVTIPCTMRGDSMRYYSMSWYRQGPSGSQEWIYNEDGTYGGGFKDRFKIRDEKFSNRFPLHILAVKQGDAATYYCRARITLEQLCSRVNQKPTDGEDRSQHFFLAAAPRAPVRQWQSTDEAFGRTKILLLLDPTMARSRCMKKTTWIPEMALPSRNLSEVIVEKSTKSEVAATTGKTTPLPTIFHTTNISLEMSSTEQNAPTSTREVICTDRFDSNMITILPGRLQLRCPQELQSLDEVSAKGFLTGTSHIEFCLWTWLFLLTGNTGGKENGGNEKWYVENDRRKLSTTMCCYNKLTFGSGTRLSILPEVTPSPSVYRLTSKDDQDLEMCLITDYSPEKLTLNTAEQHTSAVVGVATPENSEESSYLSTFWARRDQLQCAASHEGFGELEGEDPESGASAVCVTGLSLHFRTDEHLNTLSLSQLGLKIVLMKGIIFNVLMTMLLWKKKKVKPSPVTGFAKWEMS